MINLRLFRDDPSHSAFEFLSARRLPLFVLSSVCIAIELDILNFDGTIYESVMVVELEYFHLFVWLILLYFVSSSTFMCIRLWFEYYQNMRSRALVYRSEQVERLKDVLAKTREQMSTVEAQIDSLREQLYGLDKKLEHKNIGSHDFNSEQSRVEKILRK